MKLSEFNEHIKNAFPTLEDPEIMIGGELLCREEISRDSMREELHIYAIGRGRIETLEDTIEDLKATIEKWQDGLLTRGDA